MTETLYFAGGVAKVPSLEEISSLPGRIESLENDKAVKVALYRGCLDELESASRKDLFQALELTEKANELEREIDSLWSQVEQFKTELNTQVTGKLTEARILFKKMAGNGSRSFAENPVLQTAAEAMATAKDQQEGKALTEALIKAHQACTLLSGLASEQVRNTLSHHRQRAESLQ